MPTTKQMPLTPYQPESATGLVIVCAQRDYMPDGPMAVPRGNEIIDYINGIMDNYDLVVFVNDVHPSNHCSFVTHGGSLPPHCIKRSAGCEVADGFKTPKKLKFVKIGNFTAIDTHSGFFDSDGEATLLARTLKFRCANTIDICGLATDLLVRTTALDALRLRFNVAVHMRGCRGTSKEKHEATLYELLDAGVKVRQ